MRLVVFFDLPIETAGQRKDYRVFRKFLIKDGYLMMQESVYVKMVTSIPNAEYALQRIKRNRPKEGLIQVLRVTEKEFAHMVTVAGDAHESGVVDSMDRVVVL